MRRMCELCKNNEIELQYKSGVGNWFPSQCVECEEKGLRGECGLTHDPNCLKDCTFE